ncbi:MAG: hypothetical protein RL711_265 [Bacteroidota bacterium]|jgi:predicted RNA-binding protein
MSHKKQLFEHEITVLEHSRSIIADDTKSREEVIGDYKNLCDHYEEMLDQSKLITKVSDKLQNKLNSANAALADKNLELQETIDELTKAKIGKKAATITFGLAVVLFVLSEGILDPVIETVAKQVIISNPKQTAFIQYSTIILWTSMFGKLIMALLLKPLETFIEDYLLQRALAQQKALETTLKT